MPALTLQAPAKLNLYLHILGKRADGYHELESLVTFTTLTDSLQLRHEKELGLEMEGEFANEAGDGEGNLVLKAARALQAHVGTTHGATITLTKNIPVGAGLGGGSADAAAALRGLNELWELKLSPAILHQLAVPLGADVAMCLLSQSALVQGVGEVVAPRVLPKLHALLAYPRVVLSTAEVYRQYRPTQTRPVVGFGEAQSSTELLSALADTRNDLQAAAISVRPEVAEVLLALETLTPHAPLVRMSGSGACCFALYETQEDATRAEKTLRHQHADWWVKTVSTT